VFAINESANTQAAQIATNFFYTLGTWKYGIAIVQRAYVSNLHALHLGQNIAKFKSLLTFELILNYYYLLLLFRI